MVSYSLMIMVEAIALLAAFIFLLFYRKNGIDDSKKASDDRPWGNFPDLTSTRNLTVIAAIFLVGASTLFLLPKINLLNQYDYTKLTADSWDHLLVLSSWSEVDGFQTNYYSFYSKFPVAYSAQIMMYEITGLSLFDSMSIFYLLVGLAGVLVVFALSFEIISGTRSDKVLFAGIAVTVYSFLHYLNLTFVQQYPIAIGSVAALFALYSFVILGKRRHRAIILFCIAGAILALVHPFTSIFLSLLFFVYFISNKFITRNLRRDRRVIMNRISMFMAMVIIVAGMTYSVFVTTGTFETGIRWTERNLDFTLNKLSSRFLESTSSGVENSFEGRYQDVDVVMYSLNWSLPTATSISVVIYFLARKFKVQEDQEAGLLFPLAAVSAFLFVVTFAFSFVEFAFSRYFGTFALAFNVPITSFVLFKIIKRWKGSMVRYVAPSIMIIAIVASVTDPTIIPRIALGDEVLRDAKIYPSYLDIVAWNDFFNILGDDHGKMLMTNLHAAPTNNYQLANNFNNEIVLNPKNYTLTSNDAYILVDKNKLDQQIQLQENTNLDKVYDNSRIYLAD